jgi:hypothetical protein
MAKKKAKAAAKKRTFVSDFTPIVEQEIYNEDPKLNMEAMSTEECADSIAVDWMPTEGSMPDIVADKTLTGLTMPESPAEKLIIVKPLHSVGVEDVTDKLPTTCVAMRKQPRAS